MGMFSAMTGAAVAEALGVSRSSVTRWRDNGCPQNEDGRSYSLAKVVGWLMNREYKRGLGESEDGESTPEENEAKDRWQEARAKIWEMKVAEQLEVFLRREDVETQWARAMVTLSQQLQALPSALAGKMEGSTRDEAYKMLEAALRAAVEQCRLVYTNGTKEEEK